jgi:hypothetical protein
LGFWALTGFAGEWTDDRPSEPGWDRLIAFNGKIFPGFATPRQDSDGWAFKVERRPEYDGPASFGGYSGGGLWHSLITKNEEGQIGLKTIIRILPNRISERCKHHLLQWLHPYIWIHRRRAGGLG